MRINQNIKNIGPHIALSKANENLFHFSSSLKCGRLFKKKPAAEAITMATRSAHNEQYLAYKAGFSQSSFPPCVAGRIISCPFFFAGYAKNPFRPKAFATFCNTPNIMLQFKKIRISFCWKLKFD